MFEQLETCVEILGYGVVMLALTAGTLVVFKFAKVLHR